MEGEEETDEESTPPSKKRGENASQAKITRTIIDFYKKNKPVEGDLREEFQVFDEHVWSDDEEERINLLRQILENLKGRASLNTYKSVIELAFLFDRYKDNLENGESVFYNDLKKVIMTKERGSKFVKKAKKFFFVVKNCKKDSWKSCDIPPSYWRDVTNRSWEEIKNLVESDVHNDSSI